MKRKLLCVIFLLFSVKYSFSQEIMKDETGYDELSALINLNFTGTKDSWSKITPYAFYGFNTQTEQNNSGWAWHLSAGPYISSQIAIKDSAAYLPALMMQGNAGLIINEYFTAKRGASTWFLSPVNFGFKILSNFTDSSLTLTQHNLRTAIGYQLDDKLMISVQYTMGWHNAVSSSEENYKQIFGKSATEAQYLNVTAQIKVSKPDAEIPLYLIASWKNFLNDKQYNNLPHKKIISFGIATSLSFSSNAIHASPPPPADL